MTKDDCECCGDPARENNYYPYGTYCVACGDTITHPTGYGWCLAEPDGRGREHKQSRTEEEKAKIRAGYSDAG